MNAQRKQLRQLVGQSAVSGGDAIQAKVSAPPSSADRAAPEKPGGLPSQLKAGIESLSGMSMDKVNVHYNSSRPVQLNALAYAQGTDIHLAPGQERHLPHEAWHVVQQGQGRVRPTLQAKGVTINDDAGLEHEADTMGAKARAVAQRQSDTDAPSDQAGSTDAVIQNRSAATVVQRVIYKGTAYPKVAKAEFLKAARHDLEQAKFALTDASTAALSAIADHDESAQIPDALSLIRAISLSGDKTGIHEEVARVQEATTVIHAQATESVATVEVVSPANVHAVDTNMNTVDTQLDHIERIPVQDRSIGEQRTNTAFVKSKFTVATGAAQKVPVLGKLAKIIKWAAAFAGNLMKSAVRWHALGSLGAASPDGRRHLNIGPKTQTEAIATGGTPEKHGTLWASPWSPGVNAEWIKAGMHKELDFHLTTPPTREIAETMISGDANAFIAAARHDADLHIADPVNSIYWNRDNAALTRLGTEIHDLLVAGYRLVVE
jgi:hypothetical protein